MGIIIGHVPLGTNIRNLLGTIRSASGVGSRIPQLGKRSRTKTI